MNEQTAYAKTITGIYNKVYQGKNVGKIPTYIPELLNINPDKFGIAIPRKVFYTEYCQGTFLIYGIQYLWG